MGVSKNWGKTPKMDGEFSWKTPIKMDDLGVPLFFGKMHIGIIINYIVGGLTNSLHHPENGWLEDDNFLGGRHTS